MKLFTRPVRTLVLAAMVAAFSTGALAQTDEALVPFVVNADATVTAVPDDGSLDVQINVSANEETIMRLPVPKTNGVSFFGTQRQYNVPAIISNRNGKVTVNLPTQSYGNAEVLLCKANGKLVLRQKISAGSAVSNKITRLNVATGVYLLSVKGTDGNAVISRLTHDGGGLDISVTLGSENSSPTSRLAKGAAARDWTVTVGADGFDDSTYTIRPVAGRNTVQRIKLRRMGDGGGDGVVNGMFTDSRDGTPYRVVTIGSQTWMAENLNYQTANSWCYNNSADSCAKYGRLYDWSAAMGISTSYNSSKWNGSDENHQGICPGGWHIPSDQEWQTLVDNVGGYNAGKRLKSASGWRWSYRGNGEGGNGTDDYGFSALPGGTADRLIDSFDGAGVFGIWWTATEGANCCDAHVRSMSYYDDRVNFSYWASAEIGRSVRCLKDVRQ